MIMIIGNRRKINTDNYPMIKCWDNYKNVKSELPSTCQVCGCDMYMSIDRFSKNKKCICHSCSVKVCGIKKRKEINRDNYPMVKCWDNYNTKNSKLLCVCQGCGCDVHKTLYALDKQNSCYCRSCSNTIKKSATCRAKYGVDSYSKTDEFKLMINNVHSFSTGVVVGRFVEIFPSYDYSQVEYVNMNTPVKIICNALDSEGNIHGVFFKRPEVLLRGSECPRCSGKIKHKKFGYWNDKDRCMEEAKKYKNRFEFQRGSYGAYNSIRRNGWLNELEGLYDNSIIYKDYNEKIHVVYIYKFTELNTCYIGRTNNLDRRGRQHKNGVKLRDNSIKYETPMKFAIDNHIELPVVEVLEFGLCAKSSQEREKYWCDYYKKRGWLMLNKASVGVGVGSLGARLRWDYDSCREEAKKYKSKCEMKLINQSAYNSSVKNKWIDEFFT